MGNYTTNDFLKLCTDLRISLHREVYNEQTVNDIYNEISNIFGDKIISYTLKPESQELTFSHNKKENDKVKLSDFTIIIDQYILNKIVDNKEMIVSLSPELESVIDKISDNSLSVNNLYNLIAITKEENYDITIQL